MLGALQLVTGGFLLYNQALNDVMGMSQPEESYRGLWSTPLPLHAHSLENKTNLVLHS